MRFRDCYSEEIIENQALLFERAVLEGYNFDKFINAYMCSKLREKIDKRYAVQCNLLDTELLEEFEKEVKLRKSKVSFDFMLANWVGTFYAYVQDVLNIPSKDVLKIFPTKFVLSRCNGMHDYDLELLVDKLLKVKSNK